MFFKKMFVIYSLWQICVSLRPMRDGAAEVCRRVSPLVFAELIYKKCSFHLTYLFHIYFHLTHSNVFNSLFHFQFSFSVLLPRVATAMISQSLSESCETKSLVQVLPRARSSSGALVRLAHLFLSAFFFSLTSHQWPTSDSPTHAASQHPVKHPDVQRWLWESPPGCGCRLQKLCCAHWQSMVKFMMFKMMFRMFLRSENGTLHGNQKQTQGVNSIQIDGKIYYIIAYFQSFLSKLASICKHSTTKCLAMFESSIWIAFPPYWPRGY